MIGNSSAKQVIVIGSGLGGISAAISLAQEGYRVTIHEKNPRIGGKLNVLKAQGYTFDLGPSILTLPHIFERLFTRSGREMKDYIPTRPVRPHWRNFFEDGMVVDLDPDPARMADEARKVGFETFWLQPGTENEEVIEALDREGRNVVPGLCIKTCCQLLLRRE